MTRFKFPKEWLRVPLHEVAEVRTGVAKGKTGLKNPVALPYLRVANVQDGHINLAEVKRISIEREQVDRYSLRGGDILMTEGGDFDKLGRGDVWQGQIQPCLHQNHVFAVRPDVERVDPFYLSALAASEYGRTYFLGCAKRSTNLASINSSQLKAFPVLLPPLPEQRRIARILSTWDQTIATTERLLTNSLKQKQALVQRLIFGEVRLPGYSKPWKDVRLREVLREIRRRAIWDDDASYPLISVRRRSGGAFHRESLLGNQILTKKLNLAHTGDFLISKMQVIHGAMAVLPPTLDGMYVSDSYLAFEVSDTKRYELQFLGWLSTTKSMYRAAYRSSYGVHIEKMTLNLEMFLSERIRVPEDLEEQRAICDVLKSAQELVDDAQEKLRLLREEKAALVAQLLTGRRRVRLTKAETEAAP